MTEEELHSFLCAETARFPGQAVEIACQDAGLACVVSKKILRTALAEVREDGDHTLGFGPIFATSFLGYHRDDTAHAQIVEIASKPGNTSKYLWGDYVQSGLLTALWDTSAGQSDAIWAVVRSSTAGLYCRWASVKALALGAVRRDVSPATIRGSFVDYVQSLLTEETSATADDGVIATAIACQLLDNVGIDDRAQTCMERLIENPIFERGLLGPDALRAGTVVSQDELGPKAEYFLTAGRSAREPRNLAHWAAFDTATRSQSLRPLGGSSGSSPQKKSADKAKKRKQQRQSRKKNRKR